MNQQEQRQLFNVVRTLVATVALCVIWGIHSTAVVRAIDFATTPLSSTHIFATSTFKETRPSFVSAKLNDYRMSRVLSPSRSPFLLFQRTNNAIRVAKSVRAATSRWQATPFNTESSFRMIGSRIKWNISPAVSTALNVNTEFHRFQRQRSRTRLCFSTMESHHANATTTKNLPSSGSDGEDEPTEKTLTSSWNVGGLKREMKRRLARAQKKFDQITSRLEQCKAQKTKKPTGNDNPNLDVEILEAELEHAGAKVLEILQFELLMITHLRNDDPLDMVLPEPVAERALALNMTDHPPKRPPRGGPKPKGPRKMEPTRKPYRTYTSIDNIEIRVGKKAEDNDELSTNPQFRDNDDWWMHASGCPGSHVIIRCPDKDPPSTTMQEAAILAAKNSKCQGNIIKVTMCRARDIKKPPLSKPGLVQIVGYVRTVTVDMKASVKRLERLESTVEVN